MNTRRSALAFVLIKINIDGRDHLLFLAHTKWGDWGLVGGHVNKGEEGRWLDTARREAEEELTPLRYGRDFVLKGLLARPISWGPVESRSAKGAESIYSAQYFTLRFKRDPVELLAQLDRGNFLLVPQEHFSPPLWDSDVADTLRRLDDALPEGLSSVPWSWPVTVEGERVGVQIRPFRAATEAVSLDDADILEPVGHLIAAEG